MTYGSEEQNQNGNWELSVDLSFGLTEDKPTLPGEALWGEKIRKISNNELTEIKTELNLSQNSRFRAYSDSNLKETLDKEMVGYT